LVIFVAAVKNIMPKQWFHNWFGSPYYHLLYHERNNHEAEYFINNLVNYLHPAPGAKLLDIACGRGRHAVCLNNKGYEVTGIDLAIDNIVYANQHRNKTMHFYVHDMRDLAYSNHFDVAVNLFTSFGYFDKEEEHINALKGFNRALEPGGLLVLDFFNSHKMVANLIPKAIKTVRDVNFHLRKHMEGDRIIKTITFDDQGEHYEFEEKVHAFTYEDFARMFKLSGFDIEEHFGSYGLEKYDVNSSDRLIFICKKADV
jgi:2-polyprenyl-3-methyl-5-hydroxy-6-metoxy-1,4-benzoquinol methylase